MPTAVRVGMYERVKRTTTWARLSGGMPTAVRVGMYEPVKRTTALTYADPYR